MKYLNIIPDARSKGRGESFTAVADDAAGMTFWNPGALAYAKAFGVSVTHGLYYADMQYNYGAAYYSVNDKLNFGLSAMLLNESIKDSATFDPIGGITEADGSDQVNDMAIGLTYGIKVLPILGIGISAKYAQESLKGASTGSSDGTAIAIDAGVMAKGLVKKLSLGLSYKNIGSANFNGSTVKLGDKLLLGAAYDVISDKGTLKSVNVSLDGGIEEMEDIRVTAGQETTLGFGSLLFQIRAGYSVLQDLDSLAGLGAGAGIEFKNFIVDYSFNTGDELGANNRITLGYKFSSTPKADPIIEEGAEEVDKLNLPEEIPKAENLDITE